ncbi:tRNA lysidine(34) synthetase TilS [Devriesea agamarum]|uniref:tRNA lysidine(34) synthetase TilS n=1 Tax=Devriesea agamarum TaxID=472569 RepID=UPI00071DD48E|nr:tRNA lysidine(34) synthetase TilS [Devriesea agamarum]
MNAGPPRVIARARLAVRAALTHRLSELADRTDPTGLAPRVLVGVSGGADSLALAAVTAWVAHRMDLSCEAIIIDHGLQEGSASVAARAEENCYRLGVDAVHLRSVAVSTHDPGGVEQAARQARHEAFNRTVDERDALALLLAHTADDQAEQVLLALARGSGGLALAGIPRTRGVLLRPFLGTGCDEHTALTRADTEEICRLHDVQWWDDPMNADPAYLRARVRHLVMPVLHEQLGPHVSANLRRSADLLREDSNFLEDSAAQLLEAATASPSPPTTPDHDRVDRGILYLDAHTLMAAPVPLRRRVLRDASRQAAASHPGKTLGRSHILAIDALLTTWRGQGPVPLPGKIEVLRCGDRLVWRRTP